MPPDSQTATAASPGGWLRTFAGFAVLPAISVLSPLLAIPVLVRVGGADGWAGLAIGQAIGATAALVATFGWGIVGPNEVARSDPGLQRHIYWVSALMRGLLLLVALPTAIATTVLLVEGPHRLVAVIVCAGVALQGLSPTWFLVGQARPYALAAMEAAPRTAGIVAAVAATLATGEILAFAVVTGLVEAAIAANSYRVLAQRTGSVRDGLHDVGRRFREQWSLALSAVVSSGYTRLSVPIVSIVDYRALAVFAALERMQSLSRSGLRPFVNSFQAWVAVGSGPEFTRRAIRATATTAGVGILGAAAIAVGLPAADALLFGDIIQITQTEAALLAVAVAVIAGSYSTAMYFLVPSGSFRTVSVSTIVASVMGVPLIYLLTGPGGAAGAMLAIASAEVVVLLWQALTAARITRS